MRNVVITLVFLILLSGKLTAQPVQPYGAIPTSYQVEWNDLEYYMFVHFGPNTFTDKEWGNGDEDPDVFNPSDLDCRQWARTARLAGMKGIIITAKHHDGFCLWPSKYSAHTVAQSKWRDGKGDVLKELSDACREYGLKFGVYLSPWDRNHPAYGTPAYNQVFVNMLKEIYGKYGPVFEQWFDGANGEGPNGKKQVYDWPLFNGSVLAMQPNCIIFSDLGPGCRWVGNENGYAGETNWSTINVKGFEPGAKAPSREILNEGLEGGKVWVPAESDVSIRPGWFYSPETNDKVKSLNQLAQIYYASVGRNSNLILNVPADRRGHIAPEDSIRLMEFRAWRDKSFADNLALHAKIIATNTRGSASRFSPQHLIDGSSRTYWATDEGITKAYITLSFSHPVTFNRLLLQEYIALGQRVESFEIEVQEGDHFKKVATGTTIGHKRILLFPLQTTRKVRVRIIGAKACPVISELQLYKAVELLSEPQISRDKSGLVSIQCASSDPVIHYTTDGNEPGISSPVYSKPFAMIRGGVVKAKAYIDHGAKSSNIVSENFGLSSARWKPLAGDQVFEKGHDLQKAIDGDASTFVLSKAGSGTAGATFSIDLGESLVLLGFTYTPQKEADAAGTIYRYSFSISMDGRHWREVSKGSFANIRNNPTRQVVRFSQPVTGRYIRLHSLEAAKDGDTRTSAAEIGVLIR